MLKLLVAILKEAVDEHLCEQENFRRKALNLDLNRTIVNIHNVIRKV